MKNNNEFTFLNCGYEVRKVIMTLLLLWLFTINGLADSFGKERHILYEKARLLSIEDSVYNYYRKAEKLLPQNSPQDSGEHFYELAAKLLNLRALDSSKKYFAISQTYYRNAKDSLHSKAINSQYGQIFEMKHEYDSAFYYHKQAMDYFSEKYADSIVQSGIKSKSDTTFLQLYGKSLTAYALLLKNTAFPEEAIELFQKYFKFAEKITPETELAGKYINYANTLNHFQRYDESIEYYIKAEDVAEEHNFKRMLIFVYYNLGNIYFDKQDFIYSKAYAEKCIAIASPAIESEKELYYSAVGTSAKCNYRLGNRNDAAKDFEEFIKYIEENPEKDAEFQNTMLYYIQFRASEGTKEGKAVAFQIGDSLLNHLEGKYKTKYSTLFAEKEAEVKFNTDKIQELAENNKVEAHSRKKLNVALILLAILLLLSMSILLFMYKDKRSTAVEMQNLVTIKDRFIGLLAHDIRSPFSTLVTTLELMESKVLSEEQQEFILGNLKETSKNSLTMLDDILKWMQASRKDLKINKQRGNLRDFIRPAVSVIESKMQEKEIELVCSVPDDITVYADRTIINTLVRNLVANAVKFSPRNSVIEVSAHKSGKKVKLAVSDSGIGMSKESIEAVSQQSVHSTPGTDGEKGTGFGLQMCREFIEGHGSELKIESEEGKGTTVSFELELVEDSI
jgi:signal transduction histidine kinase